MESNSRLYTLETRLINFNPFNIYFIFSKKEFEKNKGVVNKIWANLTFLPSIYTIQFIKKENFIQTANDLSLIDEIDNFNILNKILGTDPDFDNFELSFIQFENTTFEKIEEEILFYFYKLSVLNLNVLNRFSHFFLKEDEIDYSLWTKYINEIKDVFKQIQEYLKKKLVNLSQSKIDSINGSFHWSGYYIQFIRRDFINRLKDNDDNNLSIQDKANFVGFNISIDKPEINSEIIIEIREKLTSSNYPGLIIKKGDKEAEMKKGLREGMFLYAFSLLNHLMYKKAKNRNRVINSDWLYSKEEFERLLEEYTAYMDNKDREMPASLASLVDKYKSLYIALYYISEEKNGTHIDNNYAGNETFESWCIRLQRRRYLNKRLHEGKIPSRDPFYQGISNLRTSLTECLTDKGLLSIKNKVDMSRNFDDIQKGDYHSSIEENNIKLPENSKWNKVKNMIYSKIDE